METDRSAGADRGEMDEEAVGGGRRLKEVREGKHPETTLNSSSTTIPTQE